MRGKHLSDSRFRWGSKLSPFSVSLETLCSKDCGVPPHLPTPCSQRLPRKKRARMSTHRACHNVLLLKRKRKKMNWSLCKRSGKGRLSCAKSLAASDAGKLSSGEPMRPSPRPCPLEPHSHCSPPLLASGTKHSSPAGQEGPLRCLPRRLRSSPWHLI